MTTSHELQLAISPKKDVAQTPTVNSSNLEDYLTWGVSEGMDESNIQRVHFAPHLNLERYTPFLEEMYRCQKSAPNEIGEDSTVESSRIIYRPNRFTQEVRATDITYGDHNSTIIDRKSVNGAPILLEIHSHPTNALFSNHDYGGIMSWLVIGRVTYGAIVLCPNIQILALATPQSKIVLVEDANKYIDKWTERYKQETEGIRQEIEFLTEEGARLTEEYSKADYDTIMALDDKVRKGELSYTEACAVVDKIKVKLMENAEIRQLRERITILRTAEQQADNTWRLQMARDLGIKLYFSTNMKDFKEFTA